MADPLCYSREEDAYVHATLHLAATIDSARPREPALRSEPLARLAEGPMESHPAGVPTTSSQAFAMGVAFSCWANALGRCPAPEEIQDEFGVHRATAFRWRAAWLAALPATKQTHRLAATDSANTTGETP